MKHGTDFGKKACEVEPGQLITWYCNGPRCRDFGGEDLDNPLMVFAVLDWFGYQNGAGADTDRIVEEYIKLLDKREVVWNDVLDILADGQATREVVAKWRRIRLRAYCLTMGEEEAVQFMKYASPMAWEALAHSSWVNRAIGHINSSREFAAGNEGGKGETFEWSGVWSAALENKALASEARMVVMRRVERLRSDIPWNKHDIFTNDREAGIYRAYMTSLAITPLDARERKGLLYGVESINGITLGQYQVLARGGIDTRGAHNLLAKACGAINSAGGNVHHLARLILEILGREDIGDELRKRVIREYLVGRIALFWNTIEGYLTSQRPDARRACDAIWAVCREDGVNHREAVLWVSMMEKHGTVTRTGNTIRMDVSISLDLAKLALACNSVSTRRVVAGRGGWHEDIFDTLKDSADAEVLMALAMLAMDEKRFNHVLRRLAERDIRASWGALSANDGRYDLYSTTLSMLMAKSGGLEPDDRAALMKYMASMKTKAAVRQEARVGI